MGRHRPNPHNIARPKYEKEQRMARAIEASPSTPSVRTISKASMTTLAPRPPLQQLDNPHVMSERGNGRRTSARLADREYAPVTNGYNLDPVKKSQILVGRKQNMAYASDAGAKTGAKRKPTYDEEDNGFTFSRTRTKKAKPAPIKPVVEEEVSRTKPTELAPKPKAARPRKKSFSSPTFPTPNEFRVERRRSARHSSEHAIGEKDKRLVEKSGNPNYLFEVKRQDHEENPFKPTRTLRRRSSEGVDHVPPAEIMFDATKIALPFADTPIIRRNKEMRKGAQAGSRRSSLGNRGRRASSLIESGRSNALPHDEVESSEFYKHIESDGMPEPRRMRQLLMWCGARALGEKPLFEKEDGNARLAAREIQSQLLKDFATKSGLSNWFDRTESTPPPTMPKANPKNLSNLVKIQELEEQIARLQTESQTWQSLLRPPAANSIQLPALSSQPMAPSAIDSSLLTDPNQKAALSSLHSFVSDTQPSLATTISSRIQKVNQNLEFEIDKFATNVHALGAYKDAAEWVANDALATAAETLERRDKKGLRKAIGEGGDEPSTRDILRGLSRVFDR